MNAAGASHQPPHAEHQPEALCPRCDYDLRGQTQLWSTSCPTTGLCSECGLEFRWTDVLGLSTRVPWLIENHRSRLGVRARFLLTSWHALRPRRFWREVNLATPMRRWPLVLYAAACVLACHLFCGVMVLAAEWTENGWPHIGWNSFSDFWQADGQRSATALLVPFASYEQRLWGADFPVWAMLFASLALMAMTPIVFLVLGETFAKARVRRRHILRGVCYGFPWALLAAVPFALAYACAITVENWGYRPARNKVFEMGLTGLLILALVAHVLWWHAFARRYLRINHTWAVAIVSVIVGVLAELTAVLVLF